MHQARRTQRAGQAADRRVPSRSGPPPLGLETLKPQRPRDEEFVARLTEIAPDCCPVVAYGALLPQRVLDIPPHGWVNLHFSLLPAWRGAAPVQHAILAGDQTTGATTFRIVLDLDAGPTFASVTEPIRPTDTSGDLLGRLAVSGADLLVRDPGRDRGRHPDARSPSRTGRAATRPRSPSTTPGSTGRPGRRDRPADPRQRPGPGGLDHLPRRAVQDQLSARIAASELAPGRAGGHQARRCGSAPRPARWSSGRSRPRARSRWRPPTGRAASPSTRTPASVR